MNANDEIILNIRTAVRDKGNGKSVNEVLIESGAGKNLLANMRQNKSPSIDRLTKLANYIGVSIDYLLTGKTDDPNPKPLVIPDVLKNVKVAASGGEGDWTQEEVDEISKFAEFLRLKRA